MERSGQHREDLASEVLARFFAEGSSKTLDQGIFERSEYPISDLSLLSGAIRAVGEKA